VFLFATCFVALVATSFAFVIRSFSVGDWQVQFGLSETQKGEILGAGMWPFGLSIVLFSLVIDKIGYGKSMIFAFACHLVSAILLLKAQSYWWLYAGSILNGLAAGTVEAVINPAIASAYTKSKTKMLTILHAGWPGGLFLAGLVILVLKKPWDFNVALVLVPTILYGLMLLKAKFPVSERVVAGVTYREMLAEAGAIGCLIVTYMIGREVSRIIGLENMTNNGFIDLPALSVTIIIGVVTVAYFLYTLSLGRPLYILMLFIMVLLATTELGIDTWVADLMKGPMEKGLGLPGGVILVYTALIMTILRFCIGPIEKALKPLGVLLTCACLAAIGLFALSQSVGIFILVSATVYGVGKTFFWPVTLGIVSERFPKGGALTLNGMGGVGMLGVGIIGSQILGFWQDTRIDKDLGTENPQLHARLMAKEEKQSLFGHYKSLDQGKVNEIADKTTLYDYRQNVAKEAKGGDIEKKLADDPTYRTLARNAYDHLIRKPGETETKTYEAMEKALLDGGVIVAEADYKKIDAEKTTLDKVTTEAKRDTMGRVAILPLIMACCYLLILLYFKATGGYKAIDLLAEKAGGPDGA
jgi:MFS family permease